MINATNSGSSYIPIEAGTYAARCFSMIHIGTIPVEFKGETKKQNKVQIKWELPTELKEFKEGEGEKPLTISKEFTLSMHEKSTLRHFLESWRGKGFTDEEARNFDITKLLGKECMVSIIHRPKADGNGVYAIISSVSTIPKGMKVDDQINPNFEFSFDDFSPEKFAGLPDYMKDKIKLSDEFKAIANPQDNEITEETFTQPDEKEPF